jgi:hypothetical protein
MFLTIASVAFIAVLFYVYQLSQHVTLGFVSLLGVELLNFTFGTSQGLLAGFHLDPFDFVGICLLLASGTRTARSMNRLHASRLFALVCMALLMVSVARGLVTYDLKTVGDEGRGLVASVAGMLYFLTAPTDPKSMRRYTWLYLYFGLALCVVAVLATAGLNVGGTAWARGSDNLAALGGRALPASAAAAISTCVFLSLGLARNAKRKWAYSLMPTIFLVFAIYLRHRTVWTTLAVGVAALPFVDGRLFRRLVPTLAVGAVLLACLVVYGQSLQGGVSTDQFSESAHNDATFLWRLNGWKDLVMDDEQSILTVLIGKSVGSGFHRIDSVTGRSLEVAPHSEYISMYLRVGVIGAVCVLLFILRPINRLWHLSRLDNAAVYPSVSSWTITVLMIAVYAITYGLDAHSFALLGICNAMISNPLTVRGGVNADIGAWPLSMDPRSAIA